MLKTLGSILAIIKAVVAGIGGISLLVGGVGILTIMSIAVITGLLDGFSPARKASALPPVDALRN